MTICEFMLILAKPSLSGKPVSFGLFDILAIVGKECCVGRIDRALGRV
ncbi:MAG: hypothetical protein HQ582_13445 [Planctomycetes bacterium]|nr:hypothetical protein [Planctomycetota bacterium]